LPGTLEHRQRVAQDEDGPHALPAAGNPADPTGNPDSSLQGRWPNAVGKLEQISDRHVFEAWLDVGQDNEIPLFRVESTTDCGSLETKDSCESKSCGIATT
jgi:hypothetical protein